MKIDFDYGTTFELCAANRLGGDHGGSKDGSEWGKRGVLLMLAMDWTNRIAAFLIASICFSRASKATYWSFHSGITEKKNRRSNFIVK